MKFKIVHEGDTRVFHSKSINPIEILPEIREFVDVSFGIGNFNTTYIDEEGDEITITRRSDFLDFLDRYKSLNGTPKIFISIQSRTTASKIADASDEFVTSFHPAHEHHVEEEVKSLGSSAWIIEPSIRSKATRNKIREVVDKIDMTQIPKDKEFISIAIGDPTKYPNLSPSKNITKIVQEKLISQQANGYVVSYGLLEARAAISKKYTLPHCAVNEEDIILSSGCSDALNIAVCSILNEGDNFLIPRPGFSFYETLASRYNFKVKYYNLLPDKEWQIDINHMRSLIDIHTKCILINNPSNPCGSVLSKSNLKDVLKVAEDFSLPIISDEIYGGMVYDDNDGKDQFYSMASLTKRVPILTCSGLSKLYLVPGWRVGWIIIHDPIGAMIKVRESLQKLSTVILGPNTLIQASVPSILFETPSNYYNELNDKLYRQSNLFYNELNRNNSLKPIKSRGAMYIMCKIDLNKLKNIKDDVDFAGKLLKEQAILVLPGQIFGIKNYFRCVICPPPHVIHEIGKRINEFCNKYSIDNKDNKLTSKL